MNHSENVDQDAVLRARTMLLGSGRLSLSQEVEAYRVLAKVSPAAYLPKLGSALVSYGYEVGDRGGQELRLALHAEAVDTGRRIDAHEPQRTAVLCQALDAYQHTLFTVGRRAEAFTVCEEITEVRRLGLERGHGEGFTYVHERLRKVLAEEGRHAEAADICGSDTASRGSKLCHSDMVEWAAELNAAGRHDEALTVFTELVDDTRRKAEADALPIAHLVWQLVHRSEMLDVAGRREEARADRQEALMTLARLAEQGESHGNSLTSWSTLFALSGRAAEPGASRDTPMPPFGADHHHWSPDTMESYLAAIPALKMEVAELTAAGHRPEAVAAHHRLTRRTAIGQRGHHYRFEEKLRPLFDEGVALARRMPEAPGASARALTDRSMFLVAAKRCDEAHADFAEAVALLDGMVPPSIVTRT
ncbi:hypothetical protein OG357_07585 [Streptomyces sp. NBC_01255]|uniref:hypothetical protein n=1 Tax=Streptomyces sp. NBC_01255 TaxID=2903798 RepID=UPI002E381A1A|nr:hypothetical protein [Streptomyces sp. NBC_01255]